MLLGPGVLGPPFRGVFWVPSVLNKELVKTSTKDSKSLHLLKIGKET